jgi:hypothetical protein
MKRILLISNVGPKSRDRSKHKNKPEPITDQNIKTDQNL